MTTRLGKPIRVLGGDGGESLSQNAHGASITMRPIMSTVDLCAALKAGWSRGGLTGGGTESQSVMHWLLTA